MKKGDLTQEQIDARYEELMRRVDADRLTQEKFVHISDWSGSWTGPWRCELVGPNCEFQPATYVRPPQPEMELWPYFACGPCMQELPTE